MSSRKYNAPNNPYSLTISRSNFTSIASDRQGKFISLASDSKICLYRPNCQKTDAPLSVRKIPRLDINTMLFNDWNPNKIQLATVSGQFFDIFAIRESHLYHTRERSACPYNITDIDWCKYNPNLLAVSSQLHDTTVWDFRSIKVPAFRIYSVCGNKLAKFRNMNFRGDRQWIATAEDCFVRMYDFRHTKRPFNEVKVHDQRIIDMKWDNIEDDCLITTSHDKTIKFWDANNLYNPINVIRLEKHSPPVGNIFCSPTGQFYATIPKPYYSKDDKTLTIWKRPSQTTSFHFDFEGDMLQSGAWQFFDKQRNRLCFFDITKKGDFRRRFVHTIALGHEVNNVLKAPSVQLNIDRQLDYAVAVSYISKNSDSLPPSYTSQNLEDINFLPHENEIIIEGTTIDKYNRFIHVPYFEDNLMVELEAINKINVQGMSTTEVNYQRAALIIQYVHPTARDTLIIFEIRFHRDYVNNGLVHMKVHDENCPLTESQVSSLLENIQKECAILKTRLNNSDFIQKKYLAKKPIDRVHRIVPRPMQIEFQYQTFYLKVLQRIPNIINNMQIFPPLSKLYIKEKEMRSKNFSRQTLRATIDNCLPSIIKDALAYEKKKILLASFPFNYIPTETDSTLPLPSMKGAKFTESGQLLVYGRKGKQIVTLISEEILTEEKDSDDSLAVHNTDAQKTSFNRTKKNFIFHIQPQIYVHTSELHIRSLHDYRSHVTEEIKIRLKYLTPEQQRENPYYIKQRLHDEINSTSSSITEKLTDRERKFSSQRFKHTGMSVSQISPLAAGSSASSLMVKSTQRVFKDIIPTQHAFNYISISDFNLKMQEKVDAIIVLHDLFEMYQADRSLGEKLCVMGDDRLQVLDDTFNVIEELEDQDITALWKAMKMYFDKCCEENNTKFKKTSTQNPMTHGVVELFLTKLINAGVYQIVAIASLIMSQLVIMEPVNRIPSFDVAEYEKTQFSSDSEDFDDSDDSSYVYESESDSDFYVKSQSTIPIKEEVKDEIIEQIERVEDAPESKLVIKRIKRPDEYSFEDTFYLLDDANESILFNYIYVCFDRHNPHTPQKHVVIENFKIVPHIPHKTEIVKAIMSPKTRIGMARMVEIYMHTLLRWRSMYRLAEIKNYVGNQSCIIESKRHVTKIKGKRIFRANCIVCEVKCTGLLTACLYCKHPGHVKCIVEWFSTQSRCPSGCGCKCLYANSI